MDGSDAPKWHKSKFAKSTNISFLEGIAGVSLQFPTNKLKTKTIHCAEPEYHYWCYHAYVRVTCYCIISETCSYSYMPGYSVSYSYFLHTVSISTLAVYSTNADLSSFYISLMSMELNDVF